MGNIRSKNSRKNNIKKRRVAEFEDEKIKLMDNFINLNKSNFKNNDLIITGKLKK